MKKPLLIISLLVAVIYACNQSGKTNSFNTLLNTSKLTPELFSVDITKDTTLLTQKGAVIKIPKGALTTNGTMVVQLEIKEAYSIQDIITAGLTTQSDGKPLSSGGMIYINAVGENTVRITQALSVAIPTSYINPDMQLYKGAVQKDSSINWTNPTPLPVNPQQLALDEGRNLFNSNCASCHAIGKDITGPDLAHTMKRINPYGEGSYYHHPYDFTRNPAQVLAAHDPYYNCLFNKWNKLNMPAFPNLTNEDLDKLYGYIENESEKRNLPIPDNGILKCIDSCELYAEVRNRLEEVKKQLEKDSTDLVEVSNVPPAISVPVQKTILTMPELEKVEPSQSKSLYYQFTIETFGWYNIDMIMKLGTDSELMVRIQGQYKQRFNIYLILPDYKVMVPGGPIKNQQDVYGFDNADGSITLPQNTQAYIVAIGEYEDKILFSKREFTTKESQQLDIELTIVTTEFVQQQIQSMALPDIKFAVTDTKNAAELRKVIKDIKNAEQLKPVNCDCNCFLIQNVANPAQAEEIDYRSK